MNLVLDEPLQRVSEVLEGVVVVLDTGGATPFTVDTKRAAAVIKKAKKDLILQQVTLVPRCRISFSF